MTLKLKVSNYDELTDDLKPLYVRQRDGTGVLDAEDITAAIKKEQRAAAKLTDTLLAECLAFDVSPHLLLPIVRQHVRVIEEKGDFAVRVVNEKGQLRIGDGSGAPMTVRQYLEELRSDPQTSGAFRQRGSDKNDKQTRGDLRTIDGKDAAAFMANLSDIAKGKVAVAA